MSVLYEPLGNNLIHVQITDTFLLNFSCINTYLFYDMLKQGHDKPVRQHKAEVKWRNTDMYILPKVSGRTNVVVSNVLNILIRKLAQIFSTLFSEQYSYNYILIRSEGQDHCVILLYFSVWDMVTLVVATCANKYSETKLVPCRDKSRIWLINTYRELHWTIVINTHCS